VPQVVIARAEAELERPREAAAALIAALGRDGGHPLETAYLQDLLRAAAVTDAHRVADILKAEAERHNFIVPGRSMPTASAIEALGMLVDDASLVGLGAMTAADALREQGRYPEALREYDRAADQYLSAADEVGWARTRLGAAATRAYTVELGPALLEAERARSILGGRALWVRLARLESTIGNLLRQLGRTQQALAAHERAAEAANRVQDLEERELVVAEVSINRSSVYQQLDDYDRAEALLRAAVAVFRQHGRPGPVALAEGLLARAFAARGHVSRALALATDVRRAMLALGRVSHAAMIGHDAVGCLLELNRPSEAAALADEIAAQLEASEAGVELGKILLQRAIASERLERYAQAADDLKRAEALFRSGGCGGWAAVVRVQLAAVLERSGAFVEALAEAAGAARELRRRQQVVASARADMVRASVLYKLDDLTSARVAAGAVRTVARRLGVPLLEYQAWRLLAELAGRENNDKAALRAYASAIRALEKSQGRILTEQRATFLQDKLAVYEAAIRLCVQAGNVRRAFTFAERGKARALIDALALRASGVPLRAKTPTARALSEELAVLRRRYDRLSSTMFDPRPQDELGAASVVGAGLVLQQELERCEARIGGVLDQLHLTGAADVERLALLQGRVYSPGRYLGPTSALVQYSVVGDEILIFIVRGGQPVQVRSVPVQAAATQIAHLRRLLELNIGAALRARADVRHLEVLDNHARILLRRLFTLLIEPVADLIDGAQRLVFVPHGMLHGIPFAALHDGTAFLVERYELVVAPSASAVKFCRQRRTKRKGRQTGPRCVVIAHSADGTLPGVLAEGEVVARLFGGTRLFEKRATVASVRQHIQTADIVHMAAHGHSRPDAPLFSHLRLADGQLTALDCLGLRLDCELVTLSACETGRGVVAPGDEPIGLTRSLLYAGARSVIQSLWQVDDDATRRLMSDMYERLRSGVGRGEALRNAQRAFLPQSAHIAFWAAFELVGDWAPLSTRSLKMSTRSPKMRDAR
jgi:CHAT domain-containing protein/tetratricopeptide (TPR) repeat protein